MEPILKSHFLNFKEAFEIKTDDSAEEEAKVFEKFVNYILFSLDDPDVFTADVELLDCVCVGGSKDTGIDGIGIRVNDRLVRNIEEIEEIVQRSKKVKVEFIFIQSKISKSFDIGEFNSFGTGVKAFFSEHSSLPESSKIGDFREVKNFVYSDQTVISKLVENPSIYLYYISTGRKPTDDNVSGTKELLKNELIENHYFDNVEISFLGGKQLINCCRELENKFEVQINTVDIFPLIVDSEDSEVKKAYAFTCSGSEFLKILKKDDGLLRRSLFNDNVRDYLGNKSGVNTEIEKTIKESPEMFLLRNNGITIVCSDFEQVRGKLVKIENPQIVNGCQTSNSLFNLKEHPNISKLQLLVRLISTEDINVSNSIVRGTNKQNQVLDEAFEATLPFHQEILEPFFLSLSNDVKIYYERRAKQYNNDPTVKKTQIVNLRILTQTFVGMFLNAPHESHIHEAKLLEKYAKKSDNRKIFIDEHSPYPYYICALTWYMFEKYFREDKVDKRYKAYKAHLSLLFRDSVGKFPPRLRVSRKSESYWKDLLELLKEPNFKNVLPDILRVFDKTENLWIKNGRSRFGIKDNKDFTDLLIEQSREHFIQKQSPIEEEHTICEGEILRIIWKEEVWFGFIKRGFQYENIYFDNRGYRGNVSNLVPNKKVKFEIGRGSRGEFAKNVQLLD